MKILLVDDSLLDRKLLIPCFSEVREFPRKILQAENGEEAMEIVANNYMDICLLLLDWQMPKNFRYSRVNGRHG